MELDGRVALITGAARGQGASHARRFVAEGANVVLADIVDASDLAGELGPCARAVTLDVIDDESWARLAVELHDDHGRLDILVNNAGVLGRVGSRLVDRDVVNARHVLDVNVLGTFLGMGAMAELLEISGHGAIVNVSSIMGARGSMANPIYAASKWAVRGLTKSAAIELAARRIRVNAVLPGVVDTDMVHSSGQTNDEILARNDARLLVKRLATTDDMTEAVLFLASDRSAYMTGGDLVIDGGWTTS